MRGVTDATSQTRFDLVVLTLDTAVLDYIEKPCRGSVRWQPVYSETTLEQVEPAPGVDGSTNPNEEPESWVDVAIARAWKLSSLRRGWDGRDSLPPQPEIVLIAENLLDRLRNVTPARLPDPFVCPVAGGGLQIEMTSGAKHLEIMFDSPSSITFLKEDDTGGGEAIDAGELSASDLPSIRQLFNWFASV
jgi:hypothetical protein